MTASPEVRPYGSWKSPLTAEMLVERRLGLGDLETNQDELFWSEYRPEESGRTSVVAWKDGQKRDLIPQPFNATSRVHEYGGGAYCVSSSHLIFVNRTDQNLYTVDLANAGTPTQITTSDSSERFGDLFMTRDGSKFVCVRERHRSHEEPINDLVLINPKSGQAVVLHSGHDFYAAPRVSPNGKRLAFIAWDHPNMPWDGTQLYICELTKNSPLHATVIAGGFAESVLHPWWMSDSKLTFASDSTGYWNLYLFDDAGVLPLTHDDAEYATPMWGLGSSHFVHRDERYLVALKRGKETAEIVAIDTHLPTETVIESSFDSYSNVVIHRGQLVFLASSSTETSSIYMRSRDGNRLVKIESSGDSLLDDRYIAEAEHLEIRDDDDEVIAYTYFYRPKNPDFQPDQDTHPPLLVLMHGGPTSKSGRSFSLAKQYYTTRGWAIADINYPGSSGYGRFYRNRLYGMWGVLDNQAAIQTVKRLIELNEVNPEQVAIKGGSAGGYAVLRALTTSDLFKVGSSHYGIADLRILASDTHKFESKYIHNLVPEDQIDARSPINHLEKLQAPVIFFQGADDRIVPPNQAELMHDALKRKGIPTALVMYEGEGHGFRNPANVIETHETDYVFFAKMLGFEAPGLEHVSLKIDNWSS